jgi:Flp pilus assembly protein TadD
MADQIEYLQTLKRRNSNPEVLNWIDLFIAQRLISVNQQTDVAFLIYDKLINARTQPTLQRLTLQSYGTTMFTSGNFDRAAEMWTQGVELFPEDWEMSNNLAYVLSAELGQHDRALELALAAIELNPNRSEPYDTIGNIYTKLGDYEKAREMLAVGMKYALSVRSRVTLVIAQINIDLAQENVDEARSKLTDIQSLMRAMPTRDVGLEQQVEDIEAKIDSVG